GQRRLASPVLRWVGHNFALLQRSIGLLLEGERAAGRSIDVDGALDAAEDDDPLSLRMGCVAAGWLLRPLVRHLHADTLSAELLARYVLDIGKRAALERTHHGVHDVG